MISVSVLPSGLYFGFVSDYNFYKGEELLLNRWATLG